MKKDGFDKIDIGELSKATKLPVSTIRYYEEKELIKSVGRNGLRRLFNSNVLDELSLIMLGRSAGFSLSEIHEFFMTNELEGLFSFLRND